MRSGSTSFLSGGSGWEHSGGCLLLSCRWGSGGVCCHGSRAGPLDSLVWCGWPCRRLALYAGVTVIAGWVTVNASTYKRGEDRHSWGLIMARPGQGCHSHTLWSCGFFCTPLWGLLICLTDGEEGLFQMEMLHREMLVSVNSFAVFVVCLCVSAHVCQLRVISDPSVISYGAWCHIWQNIWNILKWRRHKQ